MTSEKQNYQQMLDAVLGDVVKSGKRPRLLLHACCAPCSSYVLEYLSSYFSITLFFFNPNISPRSEYDMRYDELYRLVAAMGLGESVGFIDSEYEPARFYDAVRGLEKLPEGGERCRICYELRLNETARIAAEGGFDFFTTTLSISPYKNADRLNTAGRNAADKFGSRYLFSDFKKRNGYKRSIELSEKYGLYRQDFCGCVYSRAERDKRKKSANP